MKLLNVGNPKTAKGESMGYLTGILHMAPVKLSGYQVCPKASAGCAAACLNTAGRGRFDNIQNARIRKTRWFFEDRAGFLEQLRKDILALIRKADREGLKPAVRLNGTSDLPWEKFIDMEDYPGVQFYDYTKIASRAVKWARGDMPSNYHLTFSKAEDNDAEVAKVIEAGGNIAAVFNTKKKDSLPGEYRGAPVHDADKTDLRFLDPRGVAGLRAKGDAKKDTSGFVIHA